MIETVYFLLDNINVDFTVNDQNHIFKLSKIVCESKSERNLIFIFLCL